MYILFHNPTGHYTICKKLITFLIPEANYLIINKIANYDREEAEPKTTQENDSLTLLEKKL